MFANCLKNNHVNSLYYVYVFIVLILPVPYGNHRKMLGLTCLNKFLCTVCMYLCIHCVYLKSRDHKSANHVWCSPYSYIAHYKIAYCCEVRNNAAISCYLSDELEKVQKRACVLSFLVIHIIKRCS